MNRQLKGFTISDKPNRQSAIDSYRVLAEGYDLTCKFIDPVRQRAINLLKVRAGQTVIDVASGTGKSLPALSAAVGPGGTVIAIEQSLEMAKIAQLRITEMGLTNVQQLVSPIEDAAITARADAVFFHYTHDVLRTPLALTRIFDAVKPHAAIVVAGCKSATGWRSVFNPYFRQRTKGYLSTFEGLAAPWSYLEEFVPGFRIESEYFLGSGYIGTGNAKA